MVSDGIDNGVDTRLINITGTNDAPTVNTSAGNRNYAPGDGAKVIDPNITVSDPDSTNLVSATVTIGGGFVSSQDTLAVTGTLPLPGGITFDDSVSGTITLSGTATVADYQAALRQIAFENNVTPIITGTRTIVYTVSDPDGAEDSDTRDVEVTETPQPEFEIYLPFIIKPGS
jgi:hypothetical protein